MRDEERVLRANVEESERHVVQREREAETAQSELEKCRSRYLEVINEALVDYRRRVREIAEIAGVTSEVEIPKLVNDDRLLDEARIVVGFGFDGKNPLPLGDPSFSGSQQVIALARRIRRKSRAQPLTLAVEGKSVLKVPARRPITIFP